MKRVFPFLLATIFVLSGCGSQKEISTSEESNSAETVATTDILASEAADTESSEKEEGTDQTLVGEVVQAYATFIDEQVQAGELYTNAAIGLAHVDADEIPELAVIPMGAHADAVFFYSFDGKEITDLGAYGGFGSCYYERGKGVLYGTYTGQGSTFDTIGIVEKGSLKETYRLECIDLSFDSPFDKVGYEFYSGVGENRKEISKEEYREALTPFLLENREYKVLSYEDAYDEGVLPLINNTENIEEALLDTLDREDSYPRADVNKLYYGSRINPLDDEKEKFEASALDKLQGVWTSVEQGGIRSWIITGKQVKIYLAIWGESGPTGEYELEATKRIESIEEDTRQWDGEFLIHIGFEDKYYIYNEGVGVHQEGEYGAMLNRHWDPDGYSGTAGMFKDNSKSKAEIESAEVFDETKALEKLQGVWTSVGHSGSTAWIIEGKTVKIYEAVGEKSNSDKGPVWEYGFHSEAHIKSIEEDKDKSWERGEFLIRLDDRDGYYIYEESEYGINLHNNLSSEEYSASSSMFKDETKTPEDF